MLRVLLRSQKEPKLWGVLNAEGSKAELQVRVRRAYIAPGLQTCW